MPKLLVVDDDVSLRDLFEEYFGKDYKVLWATSTAEARDQIKDESPEVIVIDKLLGHESGTLLVQEGDVGEASCVLLTSFDTSAEFRAEMLGLGFLYVMHKPFSINEFKAVISRAYSHWEDNNGHRTKRGSNTIMFNPASLQKLKEAAAAFKMAVSH